MPVAYAPTTPVPVTVVLSSATVTSNFAAHSSVIRTMEPYQGRKMNLNGKVFKSISNTENGEVNTETTFRYYEENGAVWAEYSGGAIIRGNMIGRWVSKNELDLRYQHISKDGTIKTGFCKSTVIASNGNKVMIKEKWKWTCPDFSEGESEIIEI